MSNKYLSALTKACRKLDCITFPQVTPKDLLCKKIYIDDLYVPLSLEFSEHSRSHSYLLDRKDLGKPRLEVIADDRRIGKTLFCKMLALSLIDDKTGFLCYHNDSIRVAFMDGSLPVLIECSQLNSFSAEELRGYDFIELLFMLCSRSFGIELGGFSSEDFRRLMNEYTDKGITLILDGWNNITNKSAAAHLTALLNEHLQNADFFDVVITVKHLEEKPDIHIQHGAEHQFKGFYYDDIERACEKWDRILLSPGSSKSFIKQINSADGVLAGKYIISPLTLAFLYNALRRGYWDCYDPPADKGKLYKILLDSRLSSWYSECKVPLIEIKTARLLLEYIAYYMSRELLWKCSMAQLVSMTSEALKQLSNCFSQDISQLTPELAAAELLSMGIIEKYYDDGEEDALTFLNHIDGTAMQEYLTALAIDSQLVERYFSPETYFQIIEQITEKLDSDSVKIPDRFNFPCGNSHFGNRLWYEVVIFLCLINEAIKREFVDELTSRLTVDKSVSNDLLFRLIINKAETDQKIIHNAYAVMFKESVSHDAKSLIYRFIESRGQLFVDMYEYINTLYYNENNNDFSHYLEIKALLDIKSSFGKTTPLFYAQKLILSGKDYDIAAGMEIIFIQAGDHILNKRLNSPYFALFADYVDVFTSINEISPMAASVIKDKLFENGPMTILARRCLYASILWADFIDYSTVFSRSDLLYARENFSTDKFYYCELVLIFYNFFEDNSFGEPAPVEIRNAFLKYLREEIAQLNSSTISEAFAMCASLRCWDDTELMQMWQEIQELYNENKWSNVHYQWLVSQYEHRAFSNESKDDMKRNTVHNDKPINYSSFTADGKEVFSNVTLRPRQAGRHENRQNVKRLLSQIEQGSFCGSEINSEYSGKEAMADMDDNMEFNDEPITFTVINDEGEEILCTALCTFEQEDTGKNFVIYTDGSIDENGNIRIYSSIYDPNDENMNLIPIEDPEDWELVESVMTELTDAITESYTEPDPEE